MKTILAPVDFSSATEQVLGTAAALARSLDGRVVLLNITHPPSPTGDFGGYSYDLAPLVEETAKAAQVELERLQTRLENDYIKTEVVQLTGTPISLIIEQAKNLPADYIVMGSHGHGAFYDLLVGSTASGVLKDVGCPVVIVPTARIKLAKPRVIQAAATLV